ncbi:unnamed protein product, partial [Ectocarpus sp. 12 AP-2014]
MPPPSIHVRILSFSEQVEVSVGPAAVASNEQGRHRRQTQHHHHHAEIPPHRRVYVRLVVQGLGSGRDDGCGWMLDLLFPPAKRAQSLWSWCPHTWRRGVEKRGS